MPPYARQDIPVPDAPSADTVIDNIVEFILAHPLVVPCIIIALFAVAMWKRPFTRGILLFIAGGLLVYTMFV